MKKKFLIQIVLFTLAMAVHAYSIIIVVEQDDKTQSELRITSRAIEDRLLNVFFENGIVASTDSIITKKQDIAGIKNTVKLASSGMFNYILYLSVKYKDDSSEAINILQLSDISAINWQLYNSTGSKKIAESKYIPVPSSLISETEAEKKRALENLCAVLQSEIDTNIENIGR